MNEARSTLLVQAAPSETKLVAFVFTVAVFLNAALLFCVEPMLGKMLLPSLGGSPAVWSTCMAFFQVVLLAGYAYAHVSVDRLGVRTQVIVHAAVLALPLFFLPLTAKAPSGEAGVLSVLLVLGQTALVPFFVLSTGGTLLQRWYAQAAPGKNPYRLYAASNAGSLLSLLAYPLLIEPLLPTGIQNRTFAKGYAVLVAMLAICAYLARTAAVKAPASTVDSTKDAAPSRRTIATWVLYAFVPSSLLLGTTNWITMDMSPTPFLWVLPLALYLGTFVIAFGNWSGVLPSPVRTLLHAGAIVVGVGMVARSASSFMVVLHLAVFFVLSLALHGRLAQSKPSPGRLTHYFMWVSLGGALGGTFNTFLAPLLFRKVAFFVEYPLAIGLGLALLGAREDRFLGRFRRELILALAVACATLVAIWAKSEWSFLGVTVFALPVLGITALRKNALRFGVAMGIFMVLGTAGANGRTPFSERTPFGILRVVTMGQGHLLFHGTTIHGGELGAKDADGRHVARMYYAPKGPIGSLLTRRTAVGSGGGRVDVVGLGSGALAYYATPNETWTYFEIDPVVVRIARDTRFFHFLDESRASSMSFVVGDARLRLRDEPEAGVKALVVDAFSSDAIPTHLLTEEAFSLYSRKLAKDGLLVVHISNRHFRLAPIVAAGGASVGLVAKNWVDDGDDERSASSWVALASADMHETLALPAEWQTIAPAPAAWRDDFANVLSTLAL